MKTQVQTWLDFLLQQLAADSYLDGVLPSNEPLFIDRLELGANNHRVPLPDDPFAQHKTRMVGGQAGDFVQRYELVHHLPNRSSGFSGTLLREKGTDNFTLAFRSTEFREANEGGDNPRDSASGANGEIGLSGFALGQLSSMEDYYAYLKDSGTLPTNADGTPSGKLYVAGYSLGGHLAGIFTELHESEIEHVYTFNAAGRGDYDESVGTISEMLQYYRDRLLNPSIDTVTSGGPNNPAFILWERAREESLSDLSADVFDVTSNVVLTPNEDFLPDLYDSARHRYASFATFKHFATRGMQFPGFSGGVGVLFTDTDKTLGPSVNNKITTIYGHARNNDVQIVANSGINTSDENEVFIEDQPEADYFAGLINGVPRFLGGEFLGKGDFGTTHSIILILDSLSLTEALQGIDSTLSLNDTAAIYAASSNQHAFTDVHLIPAPVTPVILLGAGTAEGDSLERALDAMRRLFVGPNILTTDSDRRTGGFGLVENREQFYAHIEELKSAVGDNTFNITPVDFNFDVLSGARGQTDAGNEVAYRYALQELNPFVVTGADTAQTQSLYQQHGVEKLMALSEEYLADRALFLKALVERNIADESERTQYIPDGDFLFADFESGTVIDAADEATLSGLVPQYLFASSVGDRLNGQEMSDDHLFGGDGPDRLFGLGGEDFLEGGDGHDRLFGGLDDDADKLHGGSGHDTYVVGPGDVIFDSDQDGSVEFLGEPLTGGKLDPESGNFISADEQFSYSLTDGTLTVVGPVADGDTGPAPSFQIDSFESGDLGITLTDPTNIPAHLILDGDEDDNSLIVGSTNFDLVRGFGGDDTIEVSRNEFYQRILIEAGDGSDIINVDVDDKFNNAAPAPGIGGTIYGGLGNDNINAGQQDDTVYGEEGHDLIEGSFGLDQLHGGSENDLIDGDEDNDLIFGGVGRDFLVGASGVDSIFGGLEDDEIYGDARMSVFRGWQGADFTLLTFSDLPDDTGQFGILEETPGMMDSLHGGGGDDEIYGGGGQDFLFGEGGFDRLEGEGGDDFLFGGDGQDIIFGDINPRTYAKHTLVKSSGTNTSGDWTIQHRVYRDPVDVAGDDYLDGGVNVDVLRGGGGNDTYFFSAGYSTDVIFDEAGIDDVVQFDSGIVPEDVTASLVGEHLVLAIGAPSSGTPDTLVIENWLNPEHRIDRFKFADGTVWVADTVLALLGLPDATTSGGTGGADAIVVGTADNNLLGGTAENDLMLAHGGDDHIQGDAGDDDILGGQGHDVLLGQAGSDDVFGQEGNDELQGNEGSDLLDGGAGRDTLFGQEDDDTLIGGAGDDSIEGGSGNDVFVINRGDGHDVVSDSEGASDVLRFGADIAIDDLHFRLDGGNVDIQLKQDGVLTEDVVTIVDFETSPDTIELVELEGQTTLDRSMILSSIDEQVIVGSGTVTGDGDDSVFTVTANQPDGFNIVVDDIGGNDSLLLKGFVVPDTPSELPAIVNRPRIDDIRQEGSDLVLDVTMTSNFGGASEETGAITIKNHFGVGQVEYIDSSVFRYATAEGALANPGQYFDVQPVFNDPHETDFEWFFRKNAISVFASETLLVGTPTDDDLDNKTSFRSTLHGFAGNDGLRGDINRDTLIGGAGDDFMRGGIRNDTYHVDPNEHDVVYDNGTGDPEFIKADTIRLPDGTSLAELSFSRENDALIINNARILSFFRQTSEGFVFQIERLESDLFTIDDLPGFVQGLGLFDTIPGTDGDDDIEGIDATDDVVLSFAGDDVVNTFGGNDDITGGAGDDTLRGGSGDDIYRFGIGDGHDTVDDTSGFDELVLGTDSAPLNILDLHITRENFTDLVISRDVRDRITISDWFENGQIEQVTFSGITLNAQEVESFLVISGESPPALITPLVDQVTEDGGSFDFQFSEDTFDSQVENSEVRYSATLDTGAPLPSWLSFNESSRTFSGEPTQTDVGSLNIRVTAMNSVGLESTDDFILVVNDVNQAPVIGETITDQVAEFDFPFRLDVSSAFSDPDNDSLALTATLSDNSSLPGWLRFDASAGVFFGIPSSADVGTIAITVRGQDPSGSATSQDFNLTTQPLSVTHSGTNAGETISATNGHDVVVAEGGDDTVFLRSGNDVVVAGTGNDVIIDSEGNDTYLFRPGDGVDIVADSSGDNVVIFGSGISPDDLTVRHVNDGLFEIQLAIDYTETDTVKSSYLRLGGPNGFTGPSSTALSPNTTFRFFDGTTLSYQDVLDQLHNLTTDAADSLVGDASENMFAGGEGNDFIYGNEGNDHLLGEGGADSLFGGAGNDLLEGGAGSDLLIGHVGNDDLRGQDGDDTLAGREGDDVLSGGLGSDSLSGGLGADHFNDSPGNTVYNFEIGGGVDVIDDRGGVDEFRVSLFGDLPSVVNNLNVLQSGADLFVGISADDSVTIRNWFVDTTNQIETFRFVDNFDEEGGGDVVFTATEIEALAGLNNPPEVSASIADQGATEDSAFTFVVPGDAFSDPDAGDSLTLSASGAGGAALPGWLSFDVSTGTFSGTPLNADVGALTVEVTATDVAGLSATETFTLDVANTNDEPEVSAGIADQAATEDSAFTFVVPGMHSAIRTWATV